MSTNKIILKNKPHSLMLFEESYTRFVNRLNERGTETIFEDTTNILMDPHEITRVYNLFKYSPEYKHILENSFNENDYTKKKKIDKYLFESYLPVLYTAITESMKIATENNLSFKQEMIMENTKDVFPTCVNVIELEESLNILLNESTNLDDIYMIEESTILQSVLNAISPSNVVKFLEKLGVGMSTLVGTMIFGGYTNSSLKAEGVLGTLKGALMLTTDLFGMNNPQNSFEHSRKSIIEFDRIDGNKEIEKLFKKLIDSGASYKAGPVFIESVIKQCLDAHHMMFDNLDLSEADKEALRTKKYNPRDTNTVVMVARNVIKESFGNDTTTKNAMISFRKCLASSLSDIYKYLMIGIFSNSNDRKKIAGLLTNNSFKSNPESLILFLKNQDDEISKDLSKRAAVLVQLRIKFDEIIENLEKGATNIDKDAGKFFRLKLDAADKEISEYLLKQKNIRSQESVLPNTNTNDQNNNFLPNNRKRSILGFGN